MNEMKQHLFDRWIAFRRQEEWLMEELLDADAEKSKKFKEMRSNTIRATKNIERLLLK